jgi:hypothetical protein
MQVTMYATRYSQNSSSFTASCMVKPSMMSPPATNLSSTARLPDQTTNTAERSWRSTTHPAVAMEAIAMLFVGA